MNLEAWRLTFDVVTFLLVCVGGVYVFVANRRRATADDIAGLDARVTALEAHAEAAPSAAAIHELALSIERLSGDLKMTTERLEGLKGWAGRLERVSERMEDFLLEQAGGGRGR